MENTYLHENTGPYKGFLIIRCEECGRIKGFCTKNSTYSFKCSECGHETTLEGLKPLFVNCDKCGGTFKYMTNIREKEFTWDCLTCGSPVDVQLNKKETAYATVGYKWEGKK